ncbi:MAG TPA: hypothetical protein VNK24_10335 [Elusimicrobiota bacterium]|nr:hypothetical protein [Elusimicrobiota bacterium]
MLTQKTTQFTVPLQNKPGEIARLTQILEEEHINISGIMAETHGDEAVVRFLPEKEGAAVRRLLLGAGYMVFEKQVFELKLPNKPGEINRLLRHLIDEAVGLVSLYGTTAGDESARLILSAQPVDKAQTVLAKMAAKTHAVA